MGEHPSGRLPRSATPERYELTLVPDLPDASFEGRARIRVRVHETVDHLVLNAIELDVHRAEVMASDGRRLSGSVSADEDEERIIISVPEAMAPGCWDLEVDFTGVLNDKLRGFYRSTFKDDDGEERVIATTQFEATDARRAFPCWDEPDFKATFATTLIVDEQLTALSNGAIVSEEPAGAGKKRVVFAETIPMSTYLVAFVVGPFEATAPVASAGGVPMRIVATPGRLHLTRFAEEAGLAALNFLAGYFELPYPGDKLDHVAVPDFAFGAMENLGCVTYRANALLVDRHDASRVELERVALVVAHETAHMWFGDLVTMKWWNGIWLNEAFATFMEMLATDSFRPEWQVWVSFGTSRNGALAVDGLTQTRPIEYAVGRPEEADGMFDVLTYQKGGAVLRMLEQYLGAETFRRGIVRYLTEHRFGNTETTDLWDAIEGVSGEPVRSTMDSWIFQGGYPLISVSMTGDSKLRLTQQRFLYRGGASDERWHVPVSLRTSVGGRVEHHRLLLSEESATIDVAGPLDWVVVNEGASGFYRVRYETALLSALTGSLHEQLEPLERLSLVSDTWASVVADHAPLPDFLGLAKLLVGEDDPDVWATTLAPLGLLDRMIPDEGRPALQAFVRRVVGPAFARVGWDPVPGEPDRAGTLRARLLNALGTVGADPDVRAEARRRFESYLTDRTALAADLVTPTVQIVAQSGGEAEYQTFVTQFRHAATPQEEVRYLYALGATEHPGLLRRTLDMCLSGEVRSQDAPYLVGDILSRRAGAAVAWEFIETQWDTIVSRFPDNSIGRMLEGIAALSAPGLAERVHAFLDEHPVPQAEKLLAQSRERLDINVAFANRVRADAGRLLLEAASG